MEKHDPNSRFRKSNMAGGQLRVPRKGLMEMLDAGLSGTVTLICAPAGYGKTSLVNNWLDSRGIAPIRLSFLNDNFPHVEAAEGTFYVLDDCHRIQSLEGRHRLRVFIDCLSEMDHIVLISREELPVSLSRLRLSGAINEIRSRELTLTNKEITDWFKGLSGISFNEEQARNIQRVTEGWPLAVSLAAQVYKQDDADVNLQGVHKYFLKEIYSPLSHDLQTFLLETSHLTRLNPELVNAVTGTENGREILERLEKKNLFVLEVADEKESLRYHPLFAEFLHSESRARLGNKRLSYLHLRASHWFQENGRFPEAIEYALKGKHFRTASTLIYEHAPNFFKHGEWMKVQKWLSAFPQIPGELALIEGWCEAFAGHYDRALDCLSRMNEAKDEAFAEKSIVEGYIAICRCDPNQALNRFRAATERWYAISRYFRKGMDLNLGEVQLLRGRLGMSGHLHDTRYLYDQLSMIWRNSEMGILGYGQNVLAELFYEQDRCEEAMYFIIRGIELGQRFENMGVLVSIYLVYLRLKWKEGRINEAWTIYDQIKTKILQSRGECHWLAVLRAIEIRMILREKAADFGQFSEWMKLSQPFERTAVDFGSEYEVLTYVRGLMHRRRFSQALRLLVVWDSEAKRLGRIGSRIEILILQALSFQKMGNLRKAFDSLQEALILAEPEGYIRTFLDEGSSLAELLAAFEQKTNELQQDSRILVYVKKLLVLFERELGIRHWSERNQLLTEPLTERELDILRCIGDGLNNSRIADRLGIKVGTVKGHVVNLYGKLGVDSRAKAVARAKEIGVVRK